MPGFGGGFNILNSSPFLAVLLAVLALLVFGGAFLLWQRDLRLASHLRGIRGARRGVRRSARESRRGLQRRPSASRT